MEMALMWYDGGVNKYYDGNILQYTNGSNQHTAHLNLHSVKCQLYLNKVGAGRSSLILSQYVTEDC